MKDAAARASILDRVFIGSRPLFYGKQVHGTGIVAVREAKPFEGVPEADGFVTDLPGVTLAVFMADCVPIFIWEKAGKAIGVFHAGWRGMAKGMAKRAVESFKREFGIAPSELLYHLGPHIRDCCFKVGPDAAAQFHPDSVIRRGENTFVSLELDAERQFAEAGVTPLGLNNFPTMKLCTRCEADHFFSFRREKSTGSMMALITLDPD